MCKGIAALALSAVALCAAVPACAQTFPDTPEQHWAYDAIARLHRDGILAGYPDGLFRGNRPASRYEMAVAISAAYVHLKDIIEGLGTQIDSAKLAPTADLAPYEDALQQLRSELEAMKAWGPDIQNLERLAAEFEKELTSLGLDVEQMKSDLSGVAKRVNVLEQHQLPVDIHGDADLFLMGGFSQSHRPGITVGGQLVGASQTVGANHLYQAVGFPEDFSIFHELALNLSGNNPKGPEWHATLVESDMLGAGGGNLAAGQPGAFQSQSSTSALSPFVSANSSLYIQDLSVDIHNRVDIAMGRIGYSIDPYIFQRPNPLPYFDDRRWGDGNWTFDGALVRAPIASASLSVFAGKQSSASATNGVPLQPMVAGSIAPRFTPGGAAGQPVGLPASSFAFGGVVQGVPIDEHLGANLNVPYHNGSLDLASVFLESNSGVDADSGDPSTSGLSRVADRVEVFGGQLKWNLGALQLTGGASQSDVFNGSSAVVDRDNYAWHAGGSLSLGSLNFGLGYRDIEPLFAAPGDWGRIGLWWNPTDIRGPMANVHLNVNPRIDLSATGEWYDGIGTAVTTPAGTFAGLGTTDRINRYTATVGYKLSSALELSLGTEIVDWDLADRGAQYGNPAFLGGKPTELWYNLGFGYNIGSATTLNFLWQFSDLTPGLNSQGMPVSGFSLPTLDGRATGSLITTQLTIKF